MAMLNQPQIQPVAWYPQPSAYQQAQMMYSNNAQLPQQYGYSAQPRQQPQVIPGRVVNNASEITPQEVPMDGSVSYFPLKDFSSILAKQWTGEGQIVTVEYVLKQPAPLAATPSVEDAQNDILQKLDRIYDMLTEKQSIQAKKPIVKTDGKE